MLSPELAISLRKELNSLRKGAGRSNASKWGLVEMVLWSVHGPSRFSGFFYVQFCERREKKGGGKLTHRTPYHCLFLFMALSNTDKEVMGDDGVQTLLLKPILGAIISQMAPIANSCKGRTNLGSLSTLSIHASTSVSTHDFFCALCKPLSQHK